ncbi:MAG: ATP-binding cassette domain-containing protein [Clostridia bacterium]|nr:ATP-binding cassette domain-containing protein [Clostridia bacterium]
MTVLKLENVSKTFFSEGREVDAVRDVSLHVQKGEIFGIIGLSGAGKSTLIRCMNRLETPTSGRILVDGENILDMNTRQLRRLRKRVSMIFQQFNLLMQSTVAKNVRYPLELAHVPRAKANQRVKELLEIVGLSDKADAYPSQLSGGQKQRVAIARALATDPEVLLCDEATSALDPMTTQSILSLLQDINRRLGITIVVITHEMAVIRQICTHVAILDGGRLVEEGNVDDVFTHTRSAAGRRLFGIVADQEDEATQEPVHCIRIIFDGEHIDEPVLSRYILESGTSINILFADVNRLNGKRYGQMLIEMPENPEDGHRLIAAMRSLGLTAEEVRV